MRLIDADALVEEMIKEESFPDYTISEVQIWKFAERMVEYAPTIDAVPVVRCKNCSQSYENVSGIYCRYHFSETEADFYCGDGEPKEDDKE